MAVCQVVPHRTFPQNCTAKENTVFTLSILTYNCGNLEKADAFLRDANDEEVAVNALDGRPDFSRSIEDALIAHIDNGVGVSNEPPIDDGDFVPFAMNEDDETERRRDALWRAKYADAAARYEHGAAATREERTVRGFADRPRVSHKRAVHLGPKTEYKQTPCSPTSWKDNTKRDSQHLRHT